MRFKGIGMAALSSLALFVIAGLSGCAQPDSGSNSPTDGKSAAGGSGGGAKPQGKLIKLGFSQIGAESDWRKANTQSIKDAATEENGIKLEFSDAQQKQENQIKAIKGFIAEGVDVIAFSPVVEAGWGPVLQEAKRAGIPVIVSDRRPDVPDDLYVTFLGSDFVQEGQRAGEWLAKKTNGKAVIAELTGTVGSAPANDRAKGFRTAIAKYPDMKIVFSQTGDFTRAKGKEVMEALLKSDQGKQITALYSHNDDMALGAIQAIEEAGKKPGTDITIISVDGVKAYFEAMQAGKANCTVECNPLLGPKLVEVVKDVMAKKSVPKRIVTEEGVFDQSTAAKELPNRKY